MWKWLPGADVTLGDLGDPVGTLNDYALCVYDASPSGALLEAVVPAGGGCGPTAQGGATPCWKDKSGIGFTYKNKIRLPDGVASVKALTGTGGAARLIMKVKGANAPIPVLPLSLPLTVQVQSRAGTCWEATYSTAIVNDAAMVKALAD